MRSIITGFLHNHPKLEDELGLSPHHVIVDKKDWEEAYFAMVNEPILDKVDIETQSATEHPDESETG